MPLPHILQRSFSSQLKTISAQVPSKRAVHIEPSTQIKEDQAVPNILSQSSPFDILPVELQVEIFLHCLPPIPTFNPGQAPLSLTCVCHAWNVLVLNTPRLWSSFGIEIPESGLDVVSGDVQLMDTVKCWLHRSKPYPLSIRMIHIPNVRANESHRSAQIMALLTAEAHRWKHVEFTIPSANIYILERVRRRDLRALESLFIRTIGLFGSQGFLKFSLEDVPWSRITLVNLQLEQTLINVDHCLKMLSHAKRLAECTFNLDCTMDRYDVPHDAVSLPSLVTLILNVQRGSTHAEVSLFQFLHALHAPKLRTLHLGWSVPRKQSVRPKFSDALSFFKRFASTLRVLTIAYLPLTEQDLLVLLYQLPNITHLTLKYPLNGPSQDPITDNFLSACTFVPPSFSAVSKPTAWDGLLLPKMEHCTIECHGRAYTSAALIAFIHSRTAIYQKTDDLSALPATVMKSFRMFSVKGVMDAVESQVRRWRDDGMDVVIKSLAIR